MAKIIAELCQNHNGDFAVLEKMVESVAKTGATHIKIQNIYADNLTFRSQFENGFIENGIQKTIKRPYKEEYERLKKLELKTDQIEKFVLLSKKYDLVPMTTCFSRDNIKEIKDLGFETLKVASYDCASFQMLRELKDNFKEIIISTGATYDEEIIKASKILSNFNFSFLHCITIYPTPLEDLNLSRIKWLKNFTKEVGFSDHTLVKKDGILASKLALAFGAEIIERHYTILEEDKTKDGPVSINQEQLKQLVNFSNLDKNEQFDEINSLNLDLNKIMGSETRNLTHLEILNRDYYRGRFASRRLNNNQPENMIYNWEETNI